MTFSSSAGEVEWRLVNEHLMNGKIEPRWTTREYLIDGDAIRLYRTGKEVQFFLHPNYGAVYYTDTWGDMTLRYDRENHTIHIVQHDVDLYILEQEKTPEPTPAPPVIAIDGGTNPNNNPPGGENPPAPFFQQP